MTTPSQTVGPFFAIGLPPIQPSDQGAVRIEGRVLDGAGAPVPDALLETWQAGVDGRYGLFGRCPTEADGRFALTTVKPAPVAPQAPHIAVSVFARGLLKRLVTRIYFPDEVEANAADPVLDAVGDARETLIAQPVEPGVLRFDVVLQGERETAFLDV